MAIWVVPFPREGYKLDGILTKSSKYAPTKLLNFVNIYSVAPSKVGHCFGK